MKATAKALLTDLYQLTMNAAYYDAGKDDEATFDLFIRKLPQSWGYFLAAGIEEAIDIATTLRFTDGDIAYLRQQGLFSDAYLDFLRDFRFEGTIDAVPEGTPLTANTPLLRITAKRTQAQLLETILLNTVNFQTMVASKAARVVAAAAPARVVDFGLRRAQGADAGMLGARAAYIAGAVATSNVQAGKEYGIPISGTHAHSFVMSFETELEAFRAYAKTFPSKPTLLIDTYDTLQGARNAATIGKELEAAGKQLGAVRLDSGDLADLSKKVRTILNENGLHYVKILASNDLNEHKIAALAAAGAPIDGYGVGTEMITAKPVAAISGVYKLVEDTSGAKIKLSQGKQTYPGRKQVFRQTDANGQYTHDVLALEDESVPGTPLLERFVEAGARVRPARSLQEIREYAAACSKRLPAQVRALHATPYTMTPSAGLTSLVETLTAAHEERTYASAEATP